MFEKILKYANYSAIFVAGYTSNELVPHVWDILKGYLSGGDIMIGIIASLPFNLIALVIFIVAIAFIVWYAKRQSTKDRDDLKRIIKEAINESKEENGDSKHEL